MANGTTVTVSLTPELERFVESQIHLGRYATAGEVYLAALRLLEDREREIIASYPELKAKLERAVAQAERGELHHPDVVLEDIAALKRARAAERALKAAS